MRYRDGDKTRRDKRRRNAIFREREKEKLRENRLAKQLRGGSCVHKTAFETLEAAQQASRMPGAGRMSAYHCTRCGKFHYGHRYK